MRSPFGNPDPTRALRYAVWGLVLIGGLVALRVGPPTPDDDPARDILAVDLARRAHANTLALDAAQKALAAATIHVTRDVFKYREIRDTLRLTDTVAVRETLVRADSVVRSCIQLSESCDRFRVRAESSLATLTLDRDFWKARYEQAKPGRFDAFVRRTLPVVAFGAGLYVGARAVR